MRIDSLDYLRGLMALSVMLYHYTLWSGAEVLPASMLGKLGIYAVSMFYILSGLSLGVVYLKSTRKFSIAEFLAKRAYRIFPLFWLCVTLSICFKLINHYLSGAKLNLDFYTVAINYTVIFGFVDPSNYIAVASWSIGNELVFYSFFPVFALSYLYFNRSTAYFWLVLSFCIYLYFSFYVLDDALTLAKNWANYVNPLNQIFLFFSGVFLACFVSQSVDNKSNRTLIFVPFAAILFLLFCFYPISSSDIFLVVGWNRLSLSFLAISFVGIVYRYGYRLPQVIHWPLKTLGDCCYSIYLLHPLVSFPVVYLLSKFGYTLYFSYSLSFFLTLICSYLSYNFFERVIVEVGNKRIRLSREKN